MYFTTAKILKSFVFSLKIISGRGTNRTSNNKNAQEVTSWDKILNDFGILLPSGRRTIITEFICL